MLRLLLQRRCSEPHMQRCDTCTAIRINGWQHQRALMPRAMKVSAGC
jgi:hypothetical protein